MVWRGYYTIAVVLYSLFVRFLEHRDQIGSTQGVHKGVGRKQWTNKS